MGHSGVFSQPVQIDCISGVLFCIEARNNTSDADDQGHLQRTPPAGRMEGKAPSDHQAGRECLPQLWVHSIPAGPPPALPPQQGDREQGRSLVLCRSPLDHPLPDLPQAGARPLPDPPLYDLSRTPNPPLTMGLFSNLFGNRDHATNHVAELPQHPTANMDEPTIAQELFVDMPVPEEQDLDRVKTRLATLAEEDLSDEGYNAGFTYHSQSVRERDVVRIKSFLTQAVDQELKELGRLIGILDAELNAQRDSDSGFMQARLRARRDELEMLRMELREQRMNVTGNSGPAEIPVSTYLAGFEKGMEAYAERLMTITQYEG